MDSPLRNPAKPKHPIVQCHDLAVDLWSLTLDSVAVVWLRLGRLALLDAAALLELRRMVDEKARAPFDLSKRALCGELGTTQPQIMHGAVRHVGKAVAANRRRLARPQR